MGNTEYFNPDGKLVSVRFQGLSFLDVIDGPLEDGSELTFSSEVDVTPDKLRALLRSKEDLNLFHPNNPLNGPDVASGEIVTQVEEEFCIQRPSRS